MYDSMSGVFRDFPNFFLGGWSSNFWARSWVDSPRRARTREGWEAQRVKPRNWEFWKLEFWNLGFGGFSEFRVLKAKSFFLEVWALNGGRRVYQELYQTVSLYRHSDKKKVPQGHFIIDKQNASSFWPCLDFYHLYFSVFYFWADGKISGCHPYAQNWNNWGK